MQVAGAAPRPPRTAPECLNPSEGETTRAKGRPSLAQRWQQARARTRLQLEGRARQGARLARVGGKGVPAIRRRLARSAAQQEKASSAGGKHLSLLSIASVSMGYLPSST